MKRPSLGLWLALAWTGFAVLPWNAIGGPGFLAPGWLASFPFGLREAPAAAQLRAVNRGGIAPRRLGRVHRHVRVAHQVGQVQAVAREHRNADAGGGEAFLAGNEDRLAHGIENPIGHPLGVGIVGDLGQQGHELIATQTPDRLERSVRARAGGFECAFHDLVAVAHAATQASRHLHQQFVAGGVAERVVDILEAVEIDQ